MRRPLAVESHWLMEKQAREALAVDVSR